MLTAARALVYAALLTGAGLPIYLLSAGRGLAVTSTVRVALALMAAIGGVASGWWALASVAAMAAQPIGTLDLATVKAVLQATPLGMVLAIRMAALAGLAIAALTLRQRGLVPAAAVCGSIALATCAWTGHAGASEGSFGLLHRLADIGHLLAAGTWLAALIVLLSQAVADTTSRVFEQRLAAFATTGTVIVATLLVTGIINTLAIAGWPVPAALWRSLWMALLAIKLLAFTAMLALAALNRWHLTPTLAQNQHRAAARLRRSLLLETGLALGVVVLVSAVGLLDPSS